MTFVYIVKKVAQAWFNSMTSAQLSKTLVVQETLSTRLMKPQQDLSLAPKDKGECCE